MQHNKRNRTTHPNSRAALVPKTPSSVQEDYNSLPNGNKTPPYQSKAKSMAKQKKQLYLDVEGETSVEPRILRNIKVCVICGNSSEVVDLSANPIMKETMSSYCESDNVNLDDCLSSVCITCVFKSRAVKEVQNKFKIRLKDFSNGHIKNNINLSDIDYIYDEELSQGQLAEEKSIHKDESIQRNTEIKQRSNIRINGISELNQSLPETVRGMESSGTTNLRLSAASFLRSSNSLLNKRNCTNNATVDSVEYIEHKGSIQLDYRNYKLNDTPDCPTIKNVESINTEYNGGVQTNVLSAERIELLTITNNNPSSMASSCSNSTHSQNGLSHSMLQVIRERPESVLITESGGKINNYKKSIRPQPQRSCQYCGSSYIRKDHYTKHVRRCRNIYSRSLPSLLPTNSENKKQFNAKRLRANGLDKFKPIELSQKRSRQFHCSECPTTFDNITQLRQHRTTHLRQYKCNMCNKIFNSLNEHDFHRIICLAEIQARLEQQEEINENETYFNNDTKSVVRSERSIISRRVTRAQSRAQTEIVKNSKPTAKPISKPSRRMTVLTSVSKYIPNHNDNSDNESCHTSNDDDDDVSVADSMNLRRRIYTDNWLKKRHTSEIHDKPLVQIDNKKEYDLLLLETLKAQVQAQEFTCLVENCDFFTDTLLNLMLHDYVHHFKASWFYCQKCGSVFTSKVFLDYHLDRQNGGRFICYKCNEQFMFQHQLDSHLILHTKQINHACNKCKCEFLTEEKLNQHTKLEHNNESEKKLIRIQSKATFASSYCSYEDDYQNRREFRNYTVKILNMHLPRLPSKRPLELPGHKPYRRRIGIIEFENDRNPNCCSCK